MPVNRSIDILKPGSLSRTNWNQYVEHHPKGTIFHTAEMIEVFDATPQHHSFARAAVNRSGEIVAMLVAVRIETMTGMASSLASRSVQYAEPLCNDDAEGMNAFVELIQTHDQYMAERTIFSEVRPIGPVGTERTALEQCGYEHQGYLNYIIDLTPGADKLWANLNKSCRQNISRCQRKGVIVCEETTAAGIDRMYDLVGKSYEHAQIPLADKALFHAAREQLPPGTVHVRTVSYHGTPVSAGIMLVFKAHVYAWYGGTSRPKGITPFDLLTWDEIRWGSDQQQQRYDFGGAGWPDEEYGPRKFKSKFGGELVNYGRYRKIYSHWKMAVAKTSFRVLRGVVSPTSAK